MLRHIKLASEGLCEETVEFYVKGLTVGAGGLRMEDYRVHVRGCPQQTYIYLTISTYIYFTTFTSLHLRVV